MNRKMLDRDRSKTLHIKIDKNSRQYQHSGPTVSAFLADSRAFTGLSSTSLTDDNENDALLDWLTPTEVNDVLWMLALHGSSNS
jgi:hypothetical protein